MFDLARLSEFAGGVLGQSASDIDAPAIIQQLAEYGIDPAQSGGLGGEQLMNMLSANDIDLTQLDAGQLIMIAENFDVTDQLPELLGQLTDRAA